MPARHVAVAWISPLNLGSTVAKFHVPNTFLGKLRVVLSGPSQWRLNRWYGLLPIINAFEPELMKLSDGELRKRSLSLRYRAKSLVPLMELLPEAFAVIREAGRRTINMRHFDVQMLGGCAMHTGCIAEMQTGEGKTLTATLGMYLNALSGRGAHLATVNDYLARRDAEWMRPIYELLGVSIGVIEQPMRQDQRRKEYACDITYGTSKEFGFDFLRDRLLLRKIREQSSDFLGNMLGYTGDLGGEKPVQPEPHFCLVDEADSILIDDAGTPLIIGIEGTGTEKENTDGECFRWSAEMQDRFVEDEHFEYEHDKHKVELNADGRKFVRELPRTELMQTVGLTTLYEHIERAIRVRLEYFRDVQYVVRDGEVQIVDEFTGRIAEGRKWRDGLHEAVSAREGLYEPGGKGVKGGGGQAARVTVQDFFIRYPRLGGMTGTAWTSAREMRKIYKCRVVPIPTNRPPIRKNFPTRVFGTEAAKWQAVADEVREIHATGRPVLIGTRSIDKSEKLSVLLSGMGIEHTVLNAHRVKEEAEIISEAGHAGKVTVSTNMAGRGTDIKLGPGVADLGGLHVIATEMHDAARIDRQLMGRCGRQGDPGTNRQYLALDDELLEDAFGPKKAKRYKRKGEQSAGPFHHLAGLFKRAQYRIEKRNFRQRRVLCHVERERHKILVQMGQDPYLDNPS